MSNTLPQIHIQPSAGWLNDPNGMVLHDGRWHVFYQANPHEPVHRDIHWGHVSSPDLVTWDRHPTAFGPTPDGPDSGGCWSGVHLPWLPRPAVAYSGLISDENNSTICVREALDSDLERWTEPRVVAYTPTAVRVMRDPFCFTWGERKLAAVGAQLDSGEAAVLMYDAADSDNWHYLGVMLRSGDLNFAHPAAEIWECPQLVINDDRCWLIVSRWVAGVTLDVIAFNGRIHDDDGLPVLRATGVERVDAGSPFYAPQVALDPSNAPLLFGWIRQPDEEAAASTGISGCLTLPRRIDGSGELLSFTVDSGLQRYADAAPATRLSLKGEHPAELPQLARVRGSATVLHLVGTRQGVEIACPEGSFELWTDGEVVECFPQGAPPVTLRDAGTHQWRVSTDRATSFIVHEVAPPPTPGRPSATEATAARATA